MASGNGGFRTSIDPEKHNHEEKVRGQPMTPIERQIALKAALEIDPGVSGFSFRAFQAYLVTLVVCCCSSDSGVDGTVMGGINGMLQYQHYFDMSGVGAKTS
ncbi:hypothetical protein DXG03_004888 [Asterophora parasitica]|uniref:Uncharacterized protein n=1 Tax=Asterophora parasitica TaxID=117018 RepID=A0A9P7KI18_9AGAR|nr:hypothetical protein DXG03_004888 [Asterophora parasitica]